ncbi:hypothetical protein PR048_006711 [Dryococelus australis]|uniref:DDE-1 domain-containing protein n=1 Tax=Dryococelus australis TaxID=614101 RepID=A0ABQ9IBR7_9NEOP|nr:hypothetical protein PR048_006711 [Dryococelus australis]
MARAVIWNTTGVTNMTRENNVIILCLPPHTIHKMQPLDKTMGALKTYYNEEVRTWLRHSGRPLTPFNIQSAAIAVNGFKANGLYPVDRNIFMVLQGAIENDLPSSRPNLKDCVTPLLCSSCSNETSQQDTLTEDVSMPVQSIPGTSNIQHISAVRNSHMKLGNPGLLFQLKFLPSLTSGLENNKPLQLPDPGTCAMITSSLYKERIQNELAKCLLSHKKKDVRRGRRQKKSTVSSGGGAKSLRTKSQGSVPNESISSAEELSVHDDSSDIEVEHNGTTPDNDDAVCIFCETKYSEDTQGETWIQYVICHLWCYSECTGYESGAYLGDPLRVLSQPSPATTLGWPDNCLLLAFVFRPLHKVHNHSYYDHSGENLLGGVQVLQYARNCV